MSLGLCAGFEVHVAFVQLGAGDCLTEILNGPNKGEVGIVATPIAGLGLGLSAGVQFYAQVSNANNLNQLSSWFTYFAATAALGGGVEGTFFWNNHWSGQVVVGGDIGVEAGAGLSGALGESYTWVKLLNGWFGIEADAARGAFDVLRHLALPTGFNVQSVFSEAKTVADKNHSGEGAPACAS